MKTYLVNRDYLPRAVACAGKPITIRAVQRRRAELMDTFKSSPDLLESMNLVNLHTLRKRSEFRTAPFPWLVATLQEPLLFEATSGGLRAAL